MKTLVIAFDGLDYEEIEKFDLKHVKQEEFGRVENSEGVDKIKTSELFACFITGKTHEEHGVTGLAEWSNPWIEKFESNVKGIRFFDKFRELRQAVFESINSLNLSQRKYDKDDIEIDTLFDKIEDSRAMFVPSYNPSITWVIRAATGPLKFGYSAEDVTNYYDTREFEHRKKELFSELENDIIPPRDLLMCHFHRPDVHHHMYGDKNLGNYDEERMRKLYQETDELAAEIKEKALEKGYERIIFMSDHGLPVRKGHNENAFYSCNMELFGDKTPHITDFYKKLIPDKDN